MHFSEASQNCLASLKCMPMPYFLVNFSESNIRVFFFSLWSPLWSLIFLICAMKVSPYWLKGGSRPRFKASTNKSLNTDPFSNNDATMQLRSHPRWLWGATKLGFYGEMRMRDFTHISSTRFILPLYLAF